MTGSVVVYIVFIVTLSMSRGVPALPRLADIPYCNGMALDIYPSAQPGPRPVVVYSHGGAWRSGDKEEGYALQQLAAMLTLRGITFVSLDYRLAPAHIFPTSIEDVKCAIRFLRAHAAQYRVDSQRIGVIGNSVGAHLAALAGLADAQAGFDAGAYLNFSSTVQAVVNLWGPSDLTQLDDPNLHLIFGPTKDDLRRASPVAYISAADPPVLSVHGDMDPTLPLTQSLTFHQALLANGVASQLLVVHNAGHALTPVGGPLDPPLEVVNATIADFLVTRLIATAR